MYSGIKKTSTWDKIISKSVELNKDGYNIYKRYA